MPIQTNTNTVTVVLAALGIDIVAGILGVVWQPEQTTAILGFCGMIGTSLFFLLRQEKVIDGQEHIADQATQAATEARKVAVKAEEVKSTLEANTKATVIRLEGLQSAANTASTKADEAAVVAGATHKLVNEKFGIILRENAEMKRDRANLTKSQLDINRAEQAERDFDEHMRKQAQVDADADVKKAE